MVKELLLIAAGEGSRLRAEGLVMPKGLVPLMGVPLAARAINQFVDVGVRRVVVIINEESPELESFLRSLSTEAELDIHVQSTPSSLHSFAALLPRLKSHRFFLATVDAVYHAKDLREFSIESQNENQDALLGITQYVEDESPLPVEIDNEQNVLSVGPNASSSDWISAGIYTFSTIVADVAKEIIESGGARLRLFQQRIVEKGFRVKAHKFGAVVDIDHVSDLAKAELLLRGEL